MKPQLLILISFAVFCLNGPVAAQEPAYVDELRFVHELRQRGDTDLAIDYLNRMKVTASAQLQRELPFEFALCRKAEAVNEPDSGKRLALYAEARVELVKFRDANPNHPRHFDTKIDIADITVQEGKTQLSRAFAQQGIEAQSAELEKARKLFEQAGVELKAVASELATRLAAVKDPKTPAEAAAKVQLEKSHLRADLSVALNLFDIAQTFHREHSKAAVLIERGNHVKVAIAELQKVSANEDTYSEVWQARAWMGRCEHELGEPKKARERFLPILNARSAAAADGIRLAQFFNLLVIQEQLQNGQAERTDSIDTLLEGAHRWMRDYPRADKTPEGNGIRFLLADSLLTKAGGEKTPAAQKKDLREEARKLLGVLASTESEYTDRARQMKIRLIGQEGGFTREISQLNAFDDCYVRAQYEMMELGEDAKKLKGTELEAQREARLKTVVAALERAINLPDARLKGGNDLNNARALLPFYYLTARKYGEAIRAGEKYAQEDARLSQAALAAAYALQAYGLSVATREANLQKAVELVDEQGRKTDEASYRKLLEQERANMFKFADYCQRTWPKDLAGNLARHQIGLMNLRNDKLLEGIKILNAVTPEYPSYTAIQYLIADVSLKPENEKAAPLADADRGEKTPIPWRERGLAALRSVKEPGSKDFEQNRLYYQAKTRLGFELYRDKKYGEMETLIAPLLPKVMTVDFHPDGKTNGDLREHYRTQLNKVRLFAKVGQADADFKGGQYKKVSDSVEVVVKDFVALVPAGTKSDPLFVQSLQVLFSMALQANIRLGDLERVKSIVSVYGKAIGENPNEVAVPEILKRLVPLIRAQMKELKAKNDPAALDRGVKAFKSILDDMAKQQTKKPEPREFLLVLSQCYSSMDQIDEAVKLLERITEPKKEDAAEQAVYQSSRLQYLRVLRQQAANDPTKKEELVKKARKLLNEWMGTRDEPGWATKLIDAHKESLYLYEMEDESGAGFNKAQALVKSLSAKINDPNNVVAKNHYLECYYYMVYFLYTNGKKQTGAVREQRTAEAASRMVALEDQYKDFGTDEMKKRFLDLLNAEPPLMQAYNKAKQR